MLIRIWSLSVALALVSGLVSGIAVPASFADDNEESMESIWADESQPSKGQPPKQEIPKADTSVTRKSVEVKASPAKDLKPQDTVITPTTGQPASPPATSQIMVQEKIEVATPAPAPTAEFKEPMTPPAIFVPPTPAVQPTIQGDLQPTVKGAPATAAPLSKLDEFSGSHFIKQGGWPGIGPFRRQPGADDAFIDEAGNNLNLHLTGGRIAQATLNLVNKGATYDDFLDLQVASEFLLEGLNVKPKTIIEFNQQLEDAKDNLLNQSNSSPITINAGRYITTVNKEASQLGDGKFSFVVSVVSKDASPDVIKEHSKEISKEAGRDTFSKPGNERGAFSFLNGKSKPTTDFIIRQNQESTEAQSKNKNDLTETFSKTIQSWQDVKKVAVRQRKTDELSQILAGKALIRQTDAIKWLSTNHKYYDMNPKGIIIERFSELTPGQKYAVFVEIKEISKLMDDSNGQVLKEQNDSYKVNYTVEKINGNWFITDSAIVDKSSTPAAARPQGKSGR